VRRGGGPKKGFVNTIKMGGNSVGEKKLVFLKNQKNLELDGQGKTATGFERENLREKKRGQKMLTPLKKGKGQEKERVP